MATAIEWTDETWNPVTGCSMCSAGCANCYAENMSKRLKGMALADIAAGRDPGRKRHYLNVIGENGKFNGVLDQVPEALTDPFRWKQPRTVFVNSMSDLFHPNVPFEYIDRVFAVMALTPRHTYQILTKRTERMAEYVYEYATPVRWHTAAVNAVLPGSGRSVYDLDLRNPLPNVWLGTSVENQPVASSRIESLLKCPAAVRFLSCEPLLSGLRLRPYLSNNHTTRCPGSIAASMPSIDWVIVGGESGPGARPMHPQWARDIRDQCVSAGVPFFFKQHGEWLHESQWRNVGGFASGREHRVFDHGDGTWSYAVGKKSAGRLLDCREWNEMPARSAVSS